MRICFQALSILIFFLFASTLSAQNLHELRKLTNEDWLEMSTEERLGALNTSNNRARNHTFTGNFGRNHDLYPKWGYDFIKST